MLYTEFMMPASFTYFHRQFTVHDKLLFNIQAGPPSGIQCHVDHQKSTDILDAHVASIFRVEEYTKQETRKAGSK
jgi:hypothetical protein